MQYILPQIRLINQEIKDPAFYFGDKIDKLDLTNSFTIKLHEVRENLIVFFVHIHLQNADKSDKKNLIHVDYLILIDISKTDQIGKNIKIEKDELAHLVGMGILMIRGSLMTLLQNHPLQGFSLPVMNPLEILEKKLELKNNYFILAKD